MPSVRGWLERLLDRGEPIDVDPDAIVEAGYVGLVAAEIVLAHLREAGIQAEAAEERPGGPEGAAWMARILCRAADLEAVQRVIDDVTTLYAAVTRHATQSGGGRSVNSVGMMSSRKAS